MCPREAHFQKGKEPKVILNETRRLRWLGGDHKRCVARRIIVMQKPLSLPHVAALPPNSIEQPLQNLNVEMAGGMNSRCIKGPMEKNSGNFLTEPHTPVPKPTGDVNISLFGTSLFAYVMLNALRSVTTVPSEKLSCRMEASSVLTCRTYAPTDEGRIKMAMTLPQVSG